MSTVLRDLPILHAWPDAATPRSGPVCIRGATGAWPIHDDVASGQLQERWCDERVALVTPDGRTEPTTVGAYFAEVAAGRAAGTYLKEWHVSAHLREFAQLPLPRAFESWFDQLPSHARPDWNWIFVGPSGSGSPMHVDVMCSSAWNLLVSGRKEWTIWSPRRAAAAGHLEPELVAVTGVDDDACMTFVQLPGDVVVVPGGWAHAVRNLEDTVSLTGNWVSASNADLVSASLRATGQRTWERLVESLRAHNGGAASPPDPPPAPCGP